MQNAGTFSGAGISVRDTVAAANGVIDHGAQRVPVDLIGINTGVFLIPA